MLAKNTAKLRALVPLINQHSRNFSLVAPNARLNFIDHPRYGRVYPVVCVNEKQHNFGLAKFSCFASSLINTSIVY